MLHIITYVALASGMLAELPDMGMQLRGLVLVMCLLDFLAHSLNCTTGLSTVGMLTHGLATLLSGLAVHTTTLTISHNIYRLTK